MKKSPLIITCACVLCCVISCKKAVEKRTTLSISDIQGVYHISTFVDKTVNNIEGIVTALYSTKYHKGFFMQSRTPDNNHLTSEGIYIENKTETKVAVGAVVAVSGTVQEIQFSKPNPSELTLTSIQATVITVLEEKNAVVQPVVIAAKSIPPVIHTGLVTDVLDITKNAMDFYEACEGMLVSVVNPVVVGCAEKYGEIAVIPDGGVYAENRTNNGGIRYTYENEQTQKLIVSDIFIPLRKGNIFKNPDFTPNPGDVFNGPIEGILSFDYSHYKIYNTKKLPPLADIGAKPDMPKFAADTSVLSAASYNIENFTIADGPERVHTLALQVKQLLNTPDIIGLVEVGDDNGGDKKDIDLITAEKTLQAIIAAIKKETGIEYGFFSVDPEHGKDGGWPEMHIRNALLYRKDRMQVPYFRQGTARKDTDLKNGILTFNPGRIGTTEPAFNGVRKPLVAHLTAQGKDVFVMVNHLKSKRSDDKLYGSKRPVVRASEAVRILEGAYIGAFLKKLYKIKPQALILCMGDMNDFEFSPTLQAISGNFMVNAVNMLPPEERHTYVFQGNSQVLDGLLINKPYAAAVQVDILNINSEFTSAQGSFSDHDPILVHIRL